MMGELHSRILETERSLIELLANFCNLGLSEIDRVVCRG
uniref:Uncharacterized protein n=1 Tax=Manihot esculenta TaxID=3983 RepID=A0A2C9VIS3_MANES